MVSSNPNSNGLSIFLNIQSSKNLSPWIALRFVHSISWVLSPNTIEIWNIHWNSPCVAIVRGVSSFCHRRIAFAPPWTTIRKNCGRSPSRPAAVAVLHHQCYCHKRQRCSIAGVGQRQGRFLVAWVEAAIAKALREWIDCVWKGNQVAGWSDWTKDEVANKKGCRQ